MAKRKLFKIVVEYIALIKSKGFNVSKAYIFGSYARNNAQSDSDIDIAIILKDVNNYFDTQVELMKLRRKVNIYIEPHPIAEKDFKNHPLFSEINKASLRIV